ncbi:hypothetical protein ACQ4LE_001441 [Meloidogyne hapla]|uniref:Uncharacterized protein n=1 Tax=Meloidogyne hapla TaxID=6305 RepID=A0A1I8B4B2_MELHA
MENIEVNYVLHAFMHSSHTKLTYILNLHDKLEQHWLRLKDILEQKYFITLKDNGELNNLKHEYPPIARVEDRAASIIQAWWRGLRYRKSMLQEHKEKLKSCVLQLREAPCSEENPKEERCEPLKQRILRYLDGLLSTVLTERKVMALRLNRLADSSHVAMECMLQNRAIPTILECISDLNRSVAHLYVIRPLCTLIVKLLLYKPFVNLYVNDCLDKLLSNAIHQIHNNYNDSNVVSDQINIIKELSYYSGFAEKMRALHFDWFMQKYKQHFGKLKQNDPRFNAYRFLCNLQKRLNNFVVIKND